MAGEATWREALLVLSRALLLFRICNVKMSQMMSCFELAEEEEIKAGDSANNKIPWERWKEERRESILSSSSIREARAGADFNFVCLI